jgi:hypothetical protein
MSKLFITDGARPGPRCPAEEYAQSLGNRREREGMTEAQAILRRRKLTATQAPVPPVSYDIMNAATLMSPESGAIPSAPIVIDGIELPMFTPNRGNISLPPDQGVTRYIQEYSLLFFVYISAQTPANGVFAHALEYDFDDFGVQLRATPATPIKLTNVSGFSSTTQYIGFVGAETYIVGAWNCFFFSRRLDVQAGQISRIRLNGHAPATPANDNYDLGDFRYIDVMAGQGAPGTAIWWDRVVEMDEAEYIRTHAVFPTP